MQYLKLLSVALISSFAVVAIPGCNSSGGDPALSSASTSGSGSQQSNSPTAVRKKVFVVVLENTDSTAALQQPFLSKLTKQGALLTNYSQVGSPSQPNYIAMTSGSTWGMADDNNHTFDVRHIGNLVEEKGLSWKSYAEDYPGGCNLSASIGNYARKHEPFLSYKNVQSDPVRCARVVNSSQFAKDLSAGQMPEFSYYVPNLLNDGHDTSVAYADQWLSNTFSSLLQDPNFMENNLFIVTFDEGEQGSQIYTVLYGDSVKSGSISSVAVNHYSLLATIEQYLGLGSLGQGDATATPITGIWK